MNFKNAFYLPSGRVFLLETLDKYPIECTEMRDVSVGGKEHEVVRESLDPHVVWKHLVPYEDKWLLTVSTEKACRFNCHFCDVASLKFGGHLTKHEILEQVRFLLEASPYVKTCNKAKIGFARMGEPACNLHNVLGAMKDLPFISGSLGRDFAWLPCFNTILPEKVQEINDYGTSSEYLSWHDVIDQVCMVKEEYFNGNLHFQFSINSTDENVRQKLFGGAKVASLKDIIQTLNIFPPPQKRTYTLNFIVMEGVPIDVNYLVDLGLDKSRFMVKLIPMNATKNSEKNKLKTYANYNNYERLVELGEKFKEHNIPTCIDAIARCEEAGLCCGQLAHIFV